MRDLAHTMFYSENFEISKKSSPTDKKNSSQKDKKKRPERLG